MKGQGKVQFVVDDRRRKRAVVLDIKSYNQFLGDLIDLLLAERREEATRTLKKVEERLKAHGLL